MFFFANFGFYSLSVYFFHFLGSNPTPLYPCHNQSFHLTSGKGTTMEIRFIFLCHPGRKSISFYINIFFLNIHLIYQYICILFPRQMYIVYIVLYYLFIWLCCYMFVYVISYIFVYSVQINSINQSINLTVRKLGGLLY